MKKLFSNTMVLSFLLILIALFSPSYSYGTSETLYGVTYSSNDALFVAVGNTGTILTSADGENWDTQTSGTANWLNGIIHDGSSMFLAVGGFGTILTSSDGTTWKTALARSARGSDAQSGRRED